MKICLFCETGCASQTFKYNTNPSYKPSLGAEEFLKFD